MKINEQSLFTRFLVTGFLLMWGQAALADQYTIPLFVSAFTSDAPQGRLRIFNSSGESGTVEIYAIDDAGARFGPATFTLNAGAAVEFEPFDFSSGNPAKGLSNDLRIGDGHFRLVLDADFPIQPSAYVRAPDGTLAAMHDTVRRATVAGSGQYRYDVPIFNPASEVTQVSRLRLINSGRCGGRGDNRRVAMTAVPRPPGETVHAGAVRRRCSDADRAAAGGGRYRRIDGPVGRGHRQVAAERCRQTSPLRVVNIVTATAGYWNNLSTTAVPGAAPADHCGRSTNASSGIAIEYVTDRQRCIYVERARRASRFSESEEIRRCHDDLHAGSYGYEGIGPDAGRLTLTYDDGDVCAANLYFSSLTAGWLASHGAPAAITPRTAPGVAGPGPLRMPMT